MYLYSKIAPGQPFFLREVCALAEFESPEDKLMNPSGHPRKPLENFLFGLSCEGEGRLSIGDFPSKYSYRCHSYGKRSPKANYL